VAQQLKYYILAASTRKLVRTNLTYLCQQHTQKRIEKHILSPGMIRISPGPEYVHHNFGELFNSDVGQIGATNITHINCDQ
jgi:hypothetical protein